MNLQNKIAIVAGMNRQAGFSFRRNRIRKIFFVLALPIIFSACGNSQPENLIDEEVYIRLFAELAVLDQYDPVLFNHTSREELQEKIFEEYGTTREDFRVSHDYYEQFIRDQIKRTEKINELLRAERDSIHQYESDYRNRKRMQELENEEQTPAAQSSAGNL